MNREIGIDLDAPGGVMCKKHAASGAMIYMYLATKGVYYNEFGTEVPPAMAAACGYDVAVLGREKLKREKLANVMAQIDAEMDLVDPEKEEIVVARRGGFKVVEVGTLGSVNVIDEEVNAPLNAMPLPKAAGLDLLDQLAPPEKKAPAPEIKKTDAKSA